MTNKCPNCGFNYNDDDNFCSKCGIKISDKKFDIDESIAQFNSNHKKIKRDYTSFNKKIIDNPILSVALILILFLSALCLILFVILDNHRNQKDFLHFKNLIENPSQIPILKEETNYTKQAKTLKNVEEFLLMYLEKSTDSNEKKEQIFSLYLNEIEKLQNITTKKIDNIEECDNKTNNKICLAKIKSLFEETGLTAYSDSDSIYLYPDFQRILAKYQDYLSSDMLGFVKLRAKYNKPTSLNLELLLKPNDLANKISLFEKMLQRAQNEYVRTKIEGILYEDIRKFLFAPSIYATTTQEMKPEFKKAYNHFIKSNKNSNLSPLMMSYLDKKRMYNETNFKNDYPYKIFDKTHFEDNVKSNSLEDIFTQLRKNVFANKNMDLKLAFVFDLKSNKWRKYDSSIELASGEYVLSEPDENNNVSIYNNVFSPMQDLNILNYSKLLLISDGLYVFNRNKLTISKVTFNGKIFNTYTLNNADITSLFPGIEIINLDTLQSYNVIIEKENARANYIILSRYSQGWNDYVISCIKGDFNPLTLPNMFSVNSESDIVLSFRAGEKLSEEFQENKPDYKITIRTYGHKPSVEEKENFALYDKKTHDEEENDKNLFKPNIMPKLKSSEENIELEDDKFLNAPEQKLEPPKEKDKD